MKLKQVEELKQLIVKNIIDRVQNMVINDLMELIKKLFGNNYEDVIVVDVDGNEHNADDMIVKELKSYDINKIDEITSYEDKIYIYF